MEIFNQLNRFFVVFTFESHQTTPVETVPLHSCRLFGNHNRQSHYARRSLNDKIFRVDDPKPLSSHPCRQLGETERASLRSGSKPPDATNQNCRPTGSLSADKLTDNQVLSGTCGNRGGWTACNTSSKRISPSTAKMKICDLTWIRSTSMPWLYAYPTILPSLEIYVHKSVAGKLFVQSNSPFLVSFKSTLSFTTLVARVRSTIRYRPKQT